MLLNIIRKKLLTDEQLVEQFPEYAEQYQAVKSKFFNFCEEIQRAYDKLRVEVGESWSNAREQKKVAEIITAQPALWVSILFYMKKNNITEVAAMFMTDEKEAYLRDALFSTERFQARELQKNHKDRNTKPKTK